MLDTRPINLWNLPLMFVDYSSKYYNDYLAEFDYEQ